MFYVDEKYIKRKINMIGGVAFGYSNMKVILVINVAPSVYLLSAFILSPLNNHNIFNCV